MDLLFILDTVEFPLAPNPMLARRVAGVLAKKGHHVHLLELWDGETMPPEEPGCERTLLSFSDERVMNRVLESGRSGGTPVPLRLLKLCAHPAAGIAAVRQILLKSPHRTAAAKKAIEALYKEHSFDACIATAAPYSGSFALQQANIGAEKICWQMDPFAASQYPGGDPERKAELALAGAMDGVLIPPSLEKDYIQNGFLKGFRTRMRVLDFPSLVPPAQADPEQDASHQKMPDKNGRLRCVFVGSLYPDIRTPHYALELFAALNDPGTELCFVGGGWENYPADLLEPYRKTLGDRLIVTGPLPKKEADRWLQSADVLLSLGNRVADQVPSKLFEYFAAGKPVVHLAKIQKDPCIAYFRRWPLALLMGEWEGAGPEVCQRLLQFLQQKGRSRLPFEEAERLFPQNTPEHAARMIEKLLEECE